MKWLRRLCWWKKRNVFNLLRWPVPERITIEYLETLPDEIVFKWWKRVSNKSGLLLTAATKERFVMVSQIVWHPVVKTGHETWRQYLIETVLEYEE